MSSTYQDWFHLFLWFCPIHGHCYGYHITKGAEGPKDCFASSIKYMEQPPEEIYYDNACHLNDYCFNRAPAICSNLVIYVPLTLTVLIHIFCFSIHQKNVERQKQEEMLLTEETIGGRQLEEDKWRETIGGRQLEEDKWRETIGGRQMEGDNCKQTTEQPEVHVGRTCKTRIVLILKT